jgi:hypothetical protein
MSTPPAPNDGTVATGLVVATCPVLPVEPAHVAEARRALRAQGKDVDEAAVVRLLWAARALPCALDVLADARSAPALHEATFRGVSVDVAAAESTPASAAPSTPPAPAGPGALVAVGHLGDGVVVVEIVERRALLADGGEDAPAWCTLRFPLEGASAARDAPDVDDEPDDAAPISLHRFTLGRPG